MEAIYKNQNGDVVIRYNPHNFDKLYSPDGSQHLLPCDGGCGRPVWVGQNTVAVTCETCAANREQPDIDEYGLMQENA